MPSLIWTGIHRIFAENDGKILQSVLGMIMGPLVLLAVLLRPLEVFFALFAGSMKGRRARPGEVVYEEHESGIKGPHGGGVRVGLGIALIILVYFAWETWLYIAFMLFLLLAGMFSSM